MAQADSARTQLRYLEEVTWRTVPAAAMTNMRVTGERLKHVKKTVRSGEIRSDRQSPKIAEVGNEALGDINWELSYGGQFIPLLAAALFSSASSWATPVTVTGSTDIDFAAAGKTITQVGASFNTQFSVGQYIEVRGTTNNGTNGAPKWFKITAVTATEITVAETVVNETGTSAVIKGSMIRNGTSERSFIFEREYADVTQFIAYLGCEIADFEMNVVAEEIITGKFGIRGGNGLAAGATVGTGSATAATTTDVMTASVNVGSIMKDGSALSTAIRSIKLGLTNNLRGQPAIGTKYGIGIGAGRCLPSGEVMAYFENRDLYEDFQDHALVSLHFRTFDAAGNRYFWTLPAVRFSDDDPSADAPDKDIMEPLQFEAEIDSTTNCMIQVDRFAA